VKQEEVVSGRNVVRAVLSGDVHVIAAGASLHAANACDAGAAKCCMQSLLLSAKCTQSN
jgi:ABC-type taurine transport system substrate-binding protein